MSKPLIGRNGPAPDNAPPPAPAPPRPGRASGSETEAARRYMICRALAYAASNYYDDLFLRTGNTAADNMEELTKIFESAWAKRLNAETAQSPNIPADRP